ncbi:MULTISPECIES: prepilin-type N-terminal cleavage/methylation domain-containing protein [unclassified Dyella]|uniref:prepilin-type N-terminal cleavage/methylation domain-containing protein n=1 Tax=unclassified Dyella TaxID=2634549 RepID=UPI001E29CA37|nr:MULTISPECIES: prepilin-type N-terminal cleavage/methylation domain-containing protein [unclassified Dyella]MDR3445388.1 prepilin-type N-terminal cleavage/methylation domain-containing protein [Dyella sp.]
MKHAASRRMQGFTLLEVLGALALFAILLVGVYSGVRTATHTVRSGEAAIERVDQVRSAQQFLRRELAQARAVPLAHTDNGDPIYFKGDAHELRFVAPLPGYLGRLGPQLQALKLVSNGDGTSRLEASFALMPPDGSAPKSLGDPEVLVDHVRDGTFSYRSPDTADRAGDWRNAWDDVRAMPRIVRIVLQLDGTSTWPELDAPLRVDAAAIQGQPADLLQGLQRKTVQ